MRLRTRRHLAAAKVIDSSSVAAIANATVDVNRAAISMAAVMPFVHTL